MDITPINTKLERYLPETSSSTLGNLAQKIAHIAGDTAKFLNVSNIASPYSDLLAAQTEAQMQLMQVSLQSNLSRTEHETKMAIIRNVRVA